VTRSTNQVVTGSPTRPGRVLAITIRSFGIDWVLRAADAG
jgi:hypothetical protein